VERSDVSTDELIATATHCLSSFHCRAHKRSEVVLWLYFVSSYSIRENKSPPLQHIAALSPHQDRMANTHASLPILIPTDYRKTYSKIIRDSFHSTLLFRPCGAVRAGVLAVSCCSRQRALCLAAAAQLPS
jgi:hypothetical protein